MEPMELTIEQVTKLLAFMKAHPDGHARVDWTNENIRVLGPEQTHPTVKLSNGKLATWRDILFEISGRPSKKRS